MCLSTRVGTERSMRNVPPVCAVVHMRVRLGLHTHVKIIDCAFLPSKGICSPAIHLISQQHIAEGADGLLDWDGGAVAIPGHIRVEALKLDVLHCLV